MCLPIGAFLSDSDKMRQQYDKMRQQVLLFCRRINLFFVPLQMKREMKNALFIICKFMYQ